MSNKKFIIGAALGALAGAVAGMLLAPKSGAETRKIIKDKAKVYSAKGKAFLDKETTATQEVIKDQTEMTKKAIKKLADKVSQKLS